ncbi:tectonic-3 [Rhinatrema bivittatum]|uniref:tectonic-3 n=1 Tax=Rhinatrema bivittatum TaxID=194408 RepID=UPI001127790F|nr:tectonic-3 [Rhinatrema bivittatum]
MGLQLLLVLLKLLLGLEILPTHLGVGGILSVSESSSGKVSLKIREDETVLWRESIARRSVSVVEGTVTPARAFLGTGSVGPTLSPASTALEREAVNTEETLRSPSSSEGPTSPIPASSKGPSTATLEPQSGGDQSSTTTRALAICTCDLTPASCDLNCCCDSDCSLSDPATVFSSCLPGSTKAVSQVCVDNTLIFRSNSPLQTETISVLGAPVQFCIHLNDPHLNYFVQPQNVSDRNFHVLAAQYGGASFIRPSQALPSFPANYRAGDPILIFYNASSTLGILRQPVPMGAGVACAYKNPAGFLENKNTSCVHQLINLNISCNSDPALNAISYYQNITVLKVPSAVTNMIQSMQVAISSSELRTPSLDGSSCNNVVSQVTYEIVYSGTQGIQNVSATFMLTNLSGDSGSSLQQSFNFLFRSAQQKRVPSATFLRSGNPGYITGSPILTLIANSRQPVTIVRSLSNGRCSDHDRSDVLFGFNMKAGCWVSGVDVERESCSAFHDHLYQVLQGKNSPKFLAMFGNADPSQSQDWTQVAEQNCSMQAQGNCSSGCFVPFSLEIQVLWAKVGLRSNPQSQIVGARYKYLCKPVKCLDPVNLTSYVSFTDVTQHPEPPRGQPDHLYMRERERHTHQCG